MKIVTNIGMFKVFYGKGERVGGFRASIDVGELELEKIFAIGSNMVFPGRWKLIKVKKKKKEKTKKNTEIVKK